MASWQEFETAEPEFASRVKELFELGRHKTIATLRRDGSPRISGIECQFQNGQLGFGSMPDSVKGRDLRRDPRFALHGPTFHPEHGRESEWPGEAKISGRARAIESADPAASAAGEIFVADIESVVLTCLNEDATKLLVEFWTPTSGIRRRERE